MITEIIMVNPDHLEEYAIARAAEVLRQGGLVAFPTETVYALGAAAFNLRALDRLYQVKGRSRQRPLIMGLDSVSWMYRLAIDIPEAAVNLADAFWPGPLTLVLKRSGMVPNMVAAGGETVAMRVPGLALVRRLVAALGMPVVIPSANFAGESSSHDTAGVLSFFDGRIEMVLDGGRCGSGIETTLLDMASRPPRLLRRGAIVEDDLLGYIPDLEVHK
ncbi:MAG: L-threonylcarbamoyladenylate synthase [bacterium]|nr:L-threonylcarbamoyladenylate synthase [bacterium]MDD4559103.1 L-threonylcarbamoyladenylate synthase [bacterium]